MYCRNVDTVDNNTNTATCSETSEFEFSQYNLALHISNGEFHDIYSHQK